MMNDLEIIEMLNRIKQHIIDGDMNKKQLIGYIEHNIELVPKYLDYEKVKK